MMDDSVRGVMYIMELSRENDQWLVVTIKKSWKCWNGRGPTNWGTGDCF